MSRIRTQIPVQDATLNIRMFKHELKIIKQAAAKNRSPFSTWARMVLIATAIKEISRKKRVVEELKQLTEKQERLGLIPAKGKQGIWNWERLAKARKRT
jgi:DNA-directed RNA polymerase specialized sigma24 family protein